MTHETQVTHVSPFLAFEKGRVMTRVIKSDDSSIHYLELISDFNTFSLWIKRRLLAMNDIIVAVHLKKAISFDAKR